MRRNVTTPLRSLGPVALAAALLHLTAAPAAACPTTSHFASDAAFHAVQPEAGIQFVAEGRIGDRSGAATFELDLGATTAAPATTAQYGWVNGQAEPFTLSFNSGTGVVTFQLGGKTLNYTPGGTFTDIYVRTRATQSGTSLVVDDLDLDGCPIADNSTAVGDGIDYLRIAGGTLNDGFVLTGIATLSWGATVPTNSHLAFQIKVGTPEQIVPVESTRWSALKSRFGS
jgi:hypothetical protein